MRRAEAVGPRPRRAAAALALDVVLSLVPTGYLCRISARPLTIGATMGWRCLAPRTGPLRDPRSPAESGTSLPLPTIR